MAVNESLILLTGATGYVGGKLLPVLEEQGRKVRCLARTPAKLQSRLGPGSEAVKGDLLEPASLEKAMEGVDAAYYLVHSMEAGPAFAELERQSAQNFSTAARKAGVERIVYLGGLAHGDGLSSHLHSRQEVGRVLRKSGVKTVEFRASVILGAGSLSFELVRSLVERLPVMITPRWVSVCAQPIYIGDVISYLVAALDVPLEESRVFEIGGADRVSYLDIMKEQARVRGKKRTMVPVPVLTPWLSSLWLGMVTPLQAKVGRKLIEGVKNASVVKDESALHVFDVRPAGITYALQQANSE